MPAEHYDLAEAELSEFFTSPLGVGAQKYEPTGQTAYDANEVHLRLRNPAYRRAVQRHAAIARILVQLAPETRATLAAAYTPHGWPGLLPVIFEHTYGSFVALVLRMPRAREKCGTVQPLDWLADQAGRGDKAPRELFRALKDDCVAALRVALAEYEPLRRARVAAEKNARGAAAEERAAFRRALGGR